ncbi:MULTISPECIES: hypothetical protein [unclassified Duganella]|uniref:hypothetical protein n=1 Tax=unclassified Duganella TaxID=2636909 RepID=UPI0011C0D972|nr:MULTISPECIES: hypothetical protein [unclassified Duganella]
MQTTVDAAGHPVGEARPRGLVLRALGKASPAMSNSDRAAPHRHALAKLRAAVTFLETATTKETP